MAERYDEHGCLVVGAEAEEVIAVMRERRQRFFELQVGMNAAFYAQQNAILSAPPPPPPLRLPVITCDDHCWCCGRFLDG